MMLDIRVVVGMMEQTNYSSNWQMGTKTADGVSLPLQIILMFTYLIVIDFFLAGSVNTIQSL